MKSYTFRITIGESGFFNSGNMERMEQTMRNTIVQLYLIEHGLPLEGYNYKGGNCRLEEEAALAGYSVTFVIDKKEGEEER